MCLERSRSRLDFGEHIVAGDRRHANRNAMTARNANDGVGRGQRVGGAHVGDQPEPMRLKRRQQALDTSLEHRVVSPRRILALT